MRRCECMVRSPSKRRNRCLPWASTAVDRAAGEALGPAVAARSAGAGCAISSGTRPCQQRPDPVRRVVDRVALGHDPRKRRAPRSVCGTAHVTTSVPAGGDGALRRAVRGAHRQFRLSSPVRRLSDTRHRAPRTIAAGASGGSGHHRVRRRSRRRRACDGHRRAQRPSADARAGPAIDKAHRRVDGAAAPGEVGRRAARRARSVQPSAPRPARATAMSRSRTEQIFNLPNCSPSQTRPPTGHRASRRGTLRDGRRLAPLTRSSASIVRPPTDRAPVDAGRHAPHGSASHRGGDARRQSLVAGAVELPR